MWIVLLLPRRPPAPSIARAVVFLWTRAIRHVAAVIVLANVHDEDGANVDVDVDVDVDTYVDDDDDTFF